MVYKRSPDYLYRRNGIYYLIANLWASKSMSIKEAVGHYLRLKGA
jgi:hypothetical protein